MSEHQYLVLASDPAAALASAKDPEQFVLSVLDATKAWLVTASHVEDVAEVRARAEAIRVYAAQVGLGRDAEQAACEIRLRAERRIGELLATGQAEGTIATRGRNPGTRSGMEHPHTRTTTYKELGITDAHEAASLKELASIPEEPFDAATSRLRKAGSLSRAGVLRAAGKATHLQPGAGKQARARRPAWGRSPAGVLGDDETAVRAVFVLTEALKSWRHHAQSVEEWASRAGPVVRRLRLDWDEVVEDLRELAVVAAQLARAIEDNR